MSVAKSSMFMASGTILSRAMGFARAVLLASAIGVTTDAADAFGVANQLPNNVYAIIVGGVLNAVLVPQIIKARSHADGGKSYIDRLLTLAITVFFVVTLAITVAAPLLVSLYTSGWSPQQLALATAFAYWCLPQLFFYGLYSLLGEVLNARSAFGPYMWAPVLNNVVGLAGLIGFIVVFGADPTGTRLVEDWGFDQISWLAGSATAGIAAQALILFASWKRIGLSFKLNFKWRGVGLRPAMRAASWSLGMLVLSQIGGLVQTIVASSAVSGRSTGPAIASVAAASIAWLIFMMPHSVATVSIATAYFTKMSTHAQEGKLEALKSDLAAGLRVISIISAFASLALFVLAYPVARVFVGEFDGLVALGNVLMALMLGLLPFSFVYMMQRAFYAIEDTKTPFKFTAVQIGVHISGSITMAFLMPAQWLVVGLSALTTVTVTLQGLIAYRMLSKKIGSLANFGLASAILKFFASAALAGLAGLGMLQLLGGFAPQSFVVDSVLTSVITVALSGFVMLGVYVVILRLLKVSEIDSVVSGLKGILRR